MEFLSHEKFKTFSKPGISSLQLLSHHNSVSQRLTITRVTVEPQARQEPHIHPVSEQIWIALSGFGTILLGDGKTHSFNAGEVVRFADGDRHGFENIGHEPFVYLSITSPPIDFSKAYKNGVTDIYGFLPYTDTIITSGQPSETQLRSVAQEGFEAVINLGLHDDPRYSLQDERGLVTSLGMEYIHIPVIFSAPTTDNLRTFFSAMNQYQKRKILIHCAANKRVTAFLGLYLAIKQKQDPSEAFALMNRVWQPDTVWAAFIAENLKENGISAQK